MGKAATKHLHNRIGIVFDFDETLAPSSYDALLESVGLEPRRFREERVQPLIDDGWEATLARFYRLVEESRSRPRGERITREHIEKVGRGLQPYDGVPEMFDRLRRCARDLVEDVDVEFYLLTAGFVDIHRATPIAREFEAMWGSEFHFDEDGEIAFAKQVVTYPEKVRYVMQLAKGLGTEGPNAPQDVWEEVPDAEIYVPLSQVIYVGDGGSDMPTFSLLHDHGGIAIGVYKTSAEEWSGREKERPDRRVQNLAKAEYREDSELMRSLVLSVERICKQISLLKMSVGE